MNVKIYIDFDVILTYFEVPISVVARLMLAMR